MSLCLSTVVLSLSSTDGSSLYWRQSYALLQAQETYVDDSINMEKIRKDNPVRRDTFCFA